jgi:UDP-N-acetylglucosamine 2-epimerase (non-hydrolysing)
MPERPRFVAPSLHVPALVLRETAVRPEAVSAGAARLVGTDPVHIVAAVHELLNDPVGYARMTSAVNPYGDGHAAGRIVAMLRTFSSSDRALERLGARIEMCYNTGDATNGAQENV